MHRNADNADTAETQPDADIALDSLCELSCKCYRYLKVLHPSEAL